MRSFEVKELSVDQDRQLSERSRTLDANLFGAGRMSDWGFIESQPVIGKCDDPQAFWKDALGKDLLGVAKEILGGYGFTQSELDDKAALWVEQISGHTKDLVAYGMAQDAHFFEKASVLLDRHRDITFVRPNASLNADPEILTDRLERVNSFFHDMSPAARHEFRFIDTLDYGTVSIARSSADLDGRKFEYRIGINFQAVDTPSFSYGINSKGEIEGLSFGSSSGKVIGRLARGIACPTFEELLSSSENARAFSPQVITKKFPETLNNSLFEQDDNRSS